MSIENRQVLLASRPKGEPTPENFRLLEAEVPRPGTDQMLLRTIYLSLDPYMRGRMKLRIIARRNDANEGAPKHSRRGRRPDGRRWRQHGTRHRKPPRDPATRRRGRVGPPKSERVDAPVRA